MGTSVGNKQGLSSAFPSFYTDSGKAKRSELGYLAYGGIMFGDTQKRFGMYVGFKFFIILMYSFSCYAMSLPSVFAQ